ncbi:GNAT family N-acetyltransferase [Gelidibacter mesophilus]|uniref:GNAT family N-acetyltransferase n=1 Tax=Gelidibacter mesophilus TaxID=169050 RepID=UPI000403FFB7|nr:GNAT family N-acetyltransferase [Gelidibacter mesophilus]
MIDIRQATLEDVPEITAIYRDTIRTINSNDYSEKQIQVWSSGADDLQEWKDRIQSTYFLVAEIKNQIVGFSYLINGNHMDGLYIHKDFQRRTIGSKLLRIMESRASVNGFEVLKSDVSITAFDFFDSHYYEVDKKKKKSYKGLAFETFAMYKDL